MRRPTGQPSRQPTSKPSRQPTIQPTTSPTRTASPTLVPTPLPSRAPTPIVPTAAPALLARQAVTLVLSGLIYLDASTPEVKAAMQLAMAQVLGADLVAIEKLEVADATPGGSGRRHQRALSGSSPSPAPSASPSPSASASASASAGPSARFFTRLTFTLVVQCSDCSSVAQAQAHTLDVLRAGAGDFVTIFVAAAIQQKAGLPDGVVPLLLSSGISVSDETPSPAPTPVPTPAPTIWVQGPPGTGGVAAAAALVLLGLLVAGAWRFRQWRRKVASEKSRKRLLFLLGDSDDPQPPRPGQGGEEEASGPWSKPKPKPRPRSRASARDGPSTADAVVHLAERMLWSLGRTPPPSSRSRGYLLHGGFEDEEEEAKGTDDDVELGRPWSPPSRPSPSAFSLQRLFPPSPSRPRVLPSSLSPEEGGDKELACNALLPPIQRTRLPRTAAQQRDLQRALKRLERELLRSAKEAEALVEPPPSTLPLRSRRLLAESRVSARLGLSASSSPPSGHAIFIAPGPGDSEAWRGRGTGVDLDEEEEDMWIGPRKLFPSRSRPGPALTTQQQQQQQSRDSRAVAITVQERDTASDTTSDGDGDLTQFTSSTFSDSYYREEGDEDEDEDEEAAVVAAPVPLSSPTAQLERKKAAAAAAAAATAAATLNHQVSKPKPQPPSRPQPQPQAEAVAEAEKETKTAEALKHPPQLRLAPLRRPPSVPLALLPPPRLRPVPPPPHGAPPSTAAVVPLLAPVRRLEEVLALVLDKGQEAGREVGTMQAVNAAFAALRRLECFQTQDGEGRTILVRMEQQPDELAATREVLEEMLLETLPHALPSVVFAASTESRVRIKLREKKEKKEQGH